MLMTVHFIKNLSLPAKYPPLMTLDISKYERICKNGQGRSLSSLGLCEGLRIVAVLHI